jgi:uncharacterized protein YbaA (DUF1428 family)
MQVKGSIPFILQNGYLATMRLAKLMSDPMPFDVKRMLYGGFKTIVEA